MIVRILILHNRYREQGGEDVVVAAEAALLRSKGHVVWEEVADNRELEEGLRTAVEAVWSRSAQRRVAKRIRELGPDVVHVHNTFVRLSPSVYYACRDAGVPVVQTLHNYRLMCPSGIFFRGGRPCEDCRGRLGWPGVWHGCYRRSRVATASVAATVALHSFLGTWHRLVDLYVAPTEFARRKFIEGGLPEERVLVKPHFVAPDPGVGGGGGGYALFVGRLVVEKGVRTLLEAWKRLGGGKDAPALWIVGDGPLAGEVMETQKGKPGLRWLGRLPRPAVMALMKRAEFLVFPSEWYESFGLVIAEAYAVGLPVVAAAIGAAAELVKDGWTGLHFRPGDPEDLAVKAFQLFSWREKLEQMRRAARAEYEARYSSEANYEMLLAIYRRAGAKGSAGKEGAGL